MWLKDFVDCSMYDFSPRSLALCFIVSVAWIFGSIELISTLANFTTQWHWYVLATAYTLIINEIFVHQYCHHGRAKINTNSITYKILVFLVSVDNAYGPLTSACMMHTNHHRYADTKEDHINFKRFWHDTLLLSPWMFITNTSAKFKMSNKEQYFAEQRAVYKDILNDIWTFFCEEYRIYLTLLFWLVLYIVCPVVLFKIIFMGRFLISIFQFLTGVLGHIKLPFGYRNFNTLDSSHNNLAFHYLSLCLFNSMLHNNHHGLRRFNAGQVRWYEFDLGQYVLKLFKILMSRHE